MSAAAGVSTIAPRGGMRKDTPSPVSSSAHSFMHSLIVSISRTDVTMGTITFRFPYTAVRSSARSCALKRLRSFREIRSPRRPRAGLFSSGKDIQDGFLSDPRSIVRMTVSFSPIASTTLRYASSCSSSEGALSRSKNRNSDRNKPTPSAPDASRASISFGPAMFAKTFVRLSRSSFPESSARFLFSSIRCSACRYISSSGSVITFSPSMISLLQVRAASIASDEP